MLWQSELDNNGTMRAVMELTVAAKRYPSPDVSLRVMPDTQEQTRPRTVSAVYSLREDAAHTGECRARNLCQGRGADEADTSATFCIVCPFRVSLVLIILPGHDAANG